MATRKQNLLPCAICHEKKRLRDLYHGEMIRTPIADRIRADHPEWMDSAMICGTCMNRYRAAYVEDMIERAKGEVTDLEREVIESLHQHDLVAQNVNEEFDENLTIGQCIADKVATFGGSWTFIILFAVLLGAWIAGNTIYVLSKPFDPYPFILLNLVLSCLAAIQAPIILMSQNRQAAKDRLRSEHDYRVNLKAELEIRHLTAMLEMLMQKQWSRLLELQQLQVVMMQADLSRRPHRDASDEHAG